MEKKIIKIRGKQVAYLEIGKPQDPVFVMLHGWGADSSSFAGIIDKFEGYRVISLDLPGFGDSELVHLGMNIQDYSSWLLDFLDFVDIKPDVILAHSFGARVVAVACSLRENLTRVLVLTGAAGIENKSLYIRLVTKLAKISKYVLSTFGVVGQRISKGLASKFGSEDYVNAGEMKEIFKNTVNLDLTKYFSLITEPVLLIFGSKDKDTSVFKGKVMYELIARSELVVIEGAGHYAFVDKPERFVMEVKRFIRRNL